MADFDKIIRDHQSEDGTISAEAITQLTKAIRTAVGNEFVDKARYRDKLDEIETLKAEKQTALDAATTAESWKTKYDALNDEYSTYKTTQAAKESRSAKEAAYRSLLRDAGISERRFDTIVKCSGADIDALELDDAGKIKDADTRAAALKTEWADFVVQSNSGGANTKNPPSNTGGKPTTREEIMAITDRTARRAAIAENMELFSGGSKT